MFGLEMLDVVIGLVFFYLLLSLLASAIQEFIAGALKLRSKTLVKSIEELLNQTDATPPNANTRMIGGEAPPKNLYQEFISNHSHYGKPKVVAAKVQTNTTQSSEDSSSSNRVAQSSPKPQKESLANTFFGQTQMPSYLSSKSFADILTHVLNPDHDINGIAETINKLPPGKTKTSLQVMLKNAKNDVDGFKLHLSHWFDETMDRVSGKYKRQTQRILIGIGLILSLVFNADTLTIAGKLSQDKEARIELLQSAINYQQGATQTSSVTQRLVLPKTEQGNLNELDTLQQEDPSIALSSDNSTTLDTLVDIHKTIQDLINDELESSTSALGLGWQQESKNRAQFFKNAYRNHVPQTQARGTNESTQLNWQEHRWLYTKSWLAWWVPRTGGWLLTAIAVSLGAPFWFDLLNKLVNIRSSGQKPPTMMEMVEKAQKSSSE